MDITGHSLSHITLGRTVLRRGFYYVAPPRLAPYFRTTFYGFLASLSSTFYHKIPMRGRGYCSLPSRLISHFALTVALWQRGTPRRCMSRGINSAGRLFSKYNLVEEGITSMTSAIACMRPCCQSPAELHTSCVVKLRHCCQLSSRLCNAVFPPALASSGLIPAIESCWRSVLLLFAKNYLNIVQLSPL